MPLGARRFEELFAYMSSPSRLRRYLGNCFQNSHDAVLFVLPVFVLLIAQLLQTFVFGERLPVWPFWVLAFSYPVFLLIRNHLAHVTFRRARLNLENADYKDALAILFRCTDAEIEELACKGEGRALLEQWFKCKAESELRWRVVVHRFGGMQ